MIELPADLLQKIKRIELMAGHLVEEVFAGGRLSTFRGQGMEWEDVRAYVPGDDVRRIDWKVTAKLGITQIKQFREEREVVIYLLIDVSRSSLFGSVERLRTDVLAELAAVLALCTHRNNDRIGVIFFDSEVVGYIPPSSGKSHVFKVIREIISRQREDIDSSAQEESYSISLLSPAVDLLCRLRKRKTLVFILSDLLFDDFESALSRLSRRHEVRILWLCDPLERGLPSVGLMPLYDAESGETAWIDFGNRIGRERFQSAMKERELSILGEARRNKSLMIRLINDGSALNEFLHYLRTGRGVHSDGDKSEMEISR